MSFLANFASAKVKAKPLSFKVVDCEWKAGDTLMLHLPTKLAVRRWTKNKDSVSLDYGPLSFALAIKVQSSKYGNCDAKWPDWEVLPQTPWNYGLVLDAKVPATKDQTS